MSRRDASVIAALAPSAVDPFQEVHRQWRWARSASPHVVCDAERSPHLQGILAVQGDLLVPGIDFNTLRNEIQIQQVLDLIGFQPSTKATNQLRGPCPIHQSSSAGSRSFSVSLAKQRFYCHRCGAHGNALELWAAVYRQDIYRATLQLCQAVGRDVPWICRW